MNETCFQFTRGKILGNVGGTTQAVAIPRLRAWSALACVLSIALLSSACLNSGVSGKNAKKQSIKSGTGSGTNSSLFIEPETATIPRNTPTFQLSAQGSGATGGVRWEVIEGPGTIDPMTGVFSPLPDQVGTAVIQATSVARANTTARATIAIYAPLSARLDRLTLSYDLPDQRINSTYLRVDGGTGTPEAEIVQGPGTLTLQGGTSGRVFKYAAPIDASGGQPASVRIRVKAPVVNSLNPSQTEEETFVTLELRPRVVINCLQGLTPQVTIGSTLQFETVDGTGAGMISYRMKSGSGSIGTTSGLYAAPASLPNPATFSVIAYDEVGNSSEMQGTIIEGMTLTPLVTVTKLSPPETDKPLIVKDFTVAGGEPDASGLYTLRFSDSVNPGTEYTLAQYNALGRGRFTDPTVSNGKMLFTYLVPRSYPNGHTQLTITVKVSEPGNPSVAREARIIISDGMVVVQNEIERLRFGEDTLADEMGRSRVFDVRGGAPPYTAEPCAGADNPIQQSMIVPHGIEQFQIRGPKLADFRDAVLENGKPWRNRVGYVCFRDRSGSAPISRPVKLEQGPLLISGEGEKEVSGLAIDQSSGATKGHFYVSGWFRGTLDRQQSGAGGKAAFVIAFDAAGRKKWTRVITNATRSVPANTSITAGEREFTQVRVQTTGTATNSVILSGSVKRASDGVELGFLTRLDPSTGAILALKEFSASFVAPDPYFRENLNDGAQGTVDLTRTVRTPKSIRFESLAEDPTLQEVFVVGTQTSTFTTYITGSNQPVETDKAHTDAFLISFSPDLATAKTIKNKLNVTVQKSSYLRSGVTQDDRARDVFVQNAGVYVSGETSSLKFHTTYMDGNTARQDGGAYGGSDLFATLLNTESMRTSFAFQTGNSGNEIGGKILRAEQGYVYFSGLVKATASNDGAITNGDHSRDRSVVVKLDFSRNNTTKVLRAVALIVAHRQLDPDWVGSARVPAIAYRPTAYSDERDYPRATLFASSVVQKPQNPNNTELRAFTYLNYYGCKPGTDFYGTQEGCTGATQLPHRRNTPDNDFTRGWVQSSSGVQLTAVAITPGTDQGADLNGRRKVVFAGTVDGDFYDGMSKSGENGQGTNTDIVILEFDAVGLEPR